MTYIDEENKEVHIWDSLKHIKRENHEQKEVNDSPEREKKPNVFPGNSWWNIESVWKKASGWNLDARCSWLIVVSKQQAGAVKRIFISDQGRTKNYIMSDLTVSWTSR